MSLSNWKTLPIDTHDEGGWPRRLDAKERLNLYNHCGTDCFVLKPSTTITKEEIEASPTKHLLFPICRPTSLPKCTISPAGVKAARRRAILTRSTVGDKYNVVERDTREFIAEHNLTLKDRHASITKVILRTKPTVGVSLVYADGQRQPFRALKPQTILRLYGAHLSDAQRTRLKTLIIRK